MNAKLRNEFIDEAAKSGLEPEHVSQCLVIAKNMNRTDRNYDFIGLMQ